MADYGYLPEIKKLIDVLDVRATKEQEEEIQSKIQAVLNYVPKVGVFGKTGAGKSSLCNALFGENICAISDVEACTRDAKEVLTQMSGNKIKLLDVPGVGESEARNEEYAALYKSLLPELDAVLWVLKADDRAYAEDKAFYKNLIKPYVDAGMLFFFVLNQCDKVEPFREWSDAEHEPGAQQLKNIQRKIENVASVFSVPESKIVPVSAYERYNLTRLVDEIVFSLPKDKKITFVRGADPDNVSKKAKEEAKKGFWETVKDIVRNVADKVGDAAWWIADNVIEKGVEKGGAIVRDFLARIIPW